MNDHSYVSSQDTLFHNSFQFKKTSEEYKKYSDSAIKLHNFICYNFFIYPKSQSWVNNYRYCMAPNLNVDRDGDSTQENFRKYRGITQNLNEFVKETQKCLDDFILHLKKIDHL